MPSHAKLVCGRLERGLSDRVAWIPKSHSASLLLDEGANTIEGREAVIEGYQVRDPKPARLAFGHVSISPPDPSKPKRFCLEREQRRTFVGRMADELDLKPRALACAKPLRVE